MKVSFNRVITKKWKTHIEVWVAKRHLHGWLLTNPYIYIYIYIYMGFGTIDPPYFMKFYLASNTFSFGPENPTFTFLKSTKLKGTIVIVTVPLMFFISNFFSLSPAIPFFQSSSILFQFQCTNRDERNFHGNFCWEIES